MRIGMVVTPFTDANLRLSAQIGVTDIVARYPGPDWDDLRLVREQVERLGMRLSVIEGYLPMEAIRLGLPERTLEIIQLQRLLRNMGRAGVPILCYNFMTRTDWTRTAFALPTRGGALVNGFDLAEMAPTSSVAPTPADAPTEKQLWENLEWCLHELLPVAEEAGVKLALHPDDPPVSPLHGMPRIFRDVAAFQRLASLHPSPSNGICFCGGTFSAMGIDVAGAIRALGHRIVYVHFRDVQGAVPRFRECFHDDGQTDMAAAMRAYHEIGFHGIARPDHVPRLEGETGSASGYTMLGRLFAVGYMRGLIHAIYGRNEPQKHSAITSSSLKLS